MNPSPAARVLRPDPKRWGTRYPADQRAAHKALVVNHSREAGQRSAREQAEAAGHPSGWPQSWSPSWPLSSSITTSNASIAFTSSSSSAAGALPPVRPFDHQVDDKDIFARMFALESLIGLGDSSESKALREAAGTVRALLDCGELVLFGPSERVVADSDPTPAHGNLRRVK